MMTATVMTAITVGLAGTVLYLLVRSPTTSKPLPPGPKGLPLLGNLFDLPPEGELQWRHWSKLEHPIASLTVFGATIILINDLSIAFELLEKRGGTYSGRPWLVMALELVGWSRVTAFTPYPEVLKRYRKAIHATVGTKSALSQYDKRQEGEVRKLLSQVLKAPHEVTKHVRRQTGAVILGITYGYDVKSEGNDQFVDLADRALAELSIAAAPGAWLVDSVPALKHIPGWFPGATFQKAAARMRATFEDMAETPMALVRKNLAQGIAKPSFVSKRYVAAGGKLNEQDEDDTKWIAASLYAAGADTTVAALNTFFLAMSLHPEVQVKAHAEIDRTIGKDRLPSFADRDKLPYLDAIVKEVQRWRPVTPTSVPHATTQDDIYNGFLVPKDSTIIPNVQLFTRNEEMYPDPESFNPDRFLATPAPMNPAEFTFGFGRRACPGRLLAETSMWLTIAQSLATFEIGKAMGEDGKEIEPSVEYADGFVSHPPPFGISVKARSVEIERLIRSG